MMKLVCITILLLFANVMTFQLRMHPLRSSGKSISVLMSNSNQEETNAPLQITQTAEQPLLDETPEEKYKREKLAEIADLKAKEVFVTRNTGKYECQACGYIYDESKGLTSKGIAAGTSFAELEKFRCPQCGVNKNYFVAEQETLSGFKENLKYGIGTNTLTGNQKSNLIFGGLFLGFLVFMSGYLLE